jgi:hypothetical protein
MVYRETAHASRSTAFVLEYARVWQAAEKIVYSRTLAEPRSARTRIERVFAPGAVRVAQGRREHTSLWTVLHSPRKR